MKSKTFYVNCTKGPQGHYHDLGDICLGVRNLTRRPQQTPRQNRVPCQPFISQWQLPGCLPLSLNLSRLQEGRTVSCSTPSSQEISKTPKTEVKHLCLLTEQEGEWTRHSFSHKVTFVTYGKSTIKVIKGTLNVAKLKGPFWKHPSLLWVIPDRPVATHRRQGCISPIPPGPAAVVS